MGSMTRKLTHDTSITCKEVTKPRSKSHQPLKAYYRPLTTNAHSLQLPSCLTQQNLTRFSFFETSLAWCSSQRAPVKRSKSKCFRHCDCILSYSVVATQFFHDRENIHQQSINKGSYVPAKCELKTLAAGQTWAVVFRPSPVSYKSATQTAMSVQFTCNPV